MTTEKTDAEALMKLARVSAAGGDNATALDLYRSASTVPNAPVHLKSYAQLCIARVLVKMNKLSEAAKIYSSMAKDKSIPVGYQLEAFECTKEVARLKSKLPAHDPLASRVKTAKIPKPGLLLYISPKGADSNSGSLKKPLATLKGARDRIRAIKAAKGLPKGGIEVVVQAGVYPVTKTTVFEKQDSGTASSPITYKASGKATFTGGVKLAGFTPVKNQEILDRLPIDSRNKVVQVDLKANGAGILAPFKPRGFKVTPSPMSELFFNGQSMTIARYPNTGWLQTEKSIELPSADHGGIFEYVSDRYSRWSKAQDIRVLGYFKYLWADSTLTVTSIDASKNHVKLGAGLAYGALDANMPFFFLNLLEEIDQPGEYYIDSENGKAYIYPPKPIENAIVEISLLPEEAVRLVGVKNMNLIGLSFELCSGNGLSMDSCTDCLIAGCSISKMGGTAIVANNVTRCGILSCDIWAMGRGGVDLGGGDRKTLTPGNNYIENCHIWDLSRIDRTYTPQVLLNGVANRIAHNRFNKCPSSAMRIEGNDHIVEYNDCYNLVTETDDQGGLDMWANPSYRGNIIRYNYWGDIGSGRPCGQAGIRLDDAICGTIIYGNVFRNCSEAQFGGIQIHGGKDNTVYNNIFMDCNYALSFSHWGESRFKAFLANNASLYLHQEVETSKPPFSNKYPELSEMEERIDINRIWSNAIINCGSFMTRDNGEQTTLANQIMTSDPGFVDIKKGNYTLKPSSELISGCGFRPIPFMKIGLYKDQFRKSIPPK